MQTEVESKKVHPPDIVSRLRDPGNLRLLYQLLIFEAAYFLAYRYAMEMSPRTGSPFWLPDSVLLSALLLSQPGRWWIFLLAPLPLRFLAGSPQPSWFLLVAFGNDVLKALVAALLLRRALNGRAIRFDSLHDFWIYLGVATVLAPALSGAAGASAWVALGREFWPSFQNWFLGDALANLVLTPLVLGLAVGWRSLLYAKPRYYLEGLAVFVGLVVAERLAQTGSSSNPAILDPYDYLPVAFLLMASVRFGSTGASGALAIMSLTSLAAAGNTTHDGVDGILSTQLFLLVVGVPVMLVSVLLAQQRKTEVSLRESEMRFRNMADTVPAMIWISGVDKLAAFFNRSWLDFTGRPAERELGYGWVSSVHPDQKDACFLGYCSAFDARGAWRLEAQLRRADGEYRWMLCHGTPRFAPDGPFVGYIVSCSDITDLKAAQEASLARQKLESLGVMAGGIAHDFNNLLGGIHANAEIADDMMADGLPPIEEIQAVKAISMRASEIVRQLMIYAGNEQPELESLDLSGLVGEMLELVKFSISKSATLKTSLAKDLPSMPGNRPQIQQVVMNLVLNASEALGGQQGVITVTTALASLGEDRQIALEVSDTGAGISKEAQARIFDPFFTTKYGGRGLGLAVAQGIVRAHKGTIELATEPGRGTTFRILWPIDGSSETRQKAKAAPARVGGATGTVLVVEDEASLRLSVAKMLRKEGFTVIEASDGTAAIDLIRDQPEAIDLLLLDMTIPGASSQTVAAEMSRFRPDVKVLLTSAYSRENASAGVESKQIGGFIRKPFQLRDLVRLIRETLSA